MILINFSHPITPDQQAKIEDLTDQPVEQVLTIPSQFDQVKSFQEQIHTLVESIGFSPDDWQTKSILVNPPSYNFAALTLLAELHGRMGYFPAILRIRPVPGSTPPQYEVAEVINLQSVREEARKRR